MAKSKRYQKLLTLIDQNKKYSIEEAIELVKKTSTIKFDAGVEVHFKLGIDPKKGDQQIRGTVTLPHGTGKKIRMAAFITPDKESEAKEAGADLIGGQELIDEIKKTGKADFDIAVATPVMMKNLAVIAKILGPKGLMPSPKNDTVTMDIKGIVSEFKKGKIAFKNDDTANVHLLVGKISMESQNLIENFNEITDAIKKARPATAKGEYFKNCTLSSSMGPGIKISIK